MNEITTDLAKEVFEACGGGAPGVRSKLWIFSPGVELTRVDIIDERGEAALGKPKGAYITIEAPGLCEGDPGLKENVKKALAGQLEALAGESLKNGGCVLVAGLGNGAMTADALGPKTVERVSVSRHITEYTGLLENARPVCAIAPGVLGVTGIETCEVLRGIVERVRPSLVIAVDSLASRSTERISTTVQLADTGIAPGSGANNKRKELTRRTLGVPVIAVGVPTVVHASTISKDAVELLLSETGQTGGNELAELAGRLVSEKIGPLIVTPKEIDRIIEECAELLAGGIDLALHGKELKALRDTLN